MYKKKTKGVYPSKLTPKEKYEKNGFITYKSSEYGARVCPSYLDIPSRNSKKNMAQPEPIKIKKVDDYPKAISMLIQSPSYFYSFAGFNLVRDYCASYGITPQEGSVLIILSFHEVFFAKDFRFWCMNKLAATRNVVMLYKLGFVTPVKLPSSKGRGKVRAGYILSTLGVNFVNGYKDFFDSKMQVIKDSLGTSDMMQRRNEFFAAKDKQEQKIKDDLWNARILKKSAPKS